MEESVYLKRLEVVGFKSFAEKTVLDFQPGITGIVGPNGCGKTNIVDAIRWVLGERSAKTLRGARMEDVIFNGSTQRKTSSMAEVSLIFDNSDGALTVDFPEVAVTRRLFRDGLSEYEINRAPCRLKDIVDLFLDTGIGTDSYSLMEQGRVDFILHAKPQERRELFEEAAGVSKYKARRDEALRKLEKTSMDLSRVEDILRELESQMKRLEAQARKARQVGEWQKELASLEMAGFAREGERLSEELKKKEAERKSAEANCAGAEAHLSTAESHVSKIRILLTEKEKQEQEAREESYSLDTQLARQEDAIYLSRERIGNISETESRAKGILSESEKRSGALRKNMDLIEAELKRLPSSEDPANLAQKEKELRELRENLTRQERLLQDSGRRMQELSSQNAQLALENSECLRRAEEAQERLKEIEAERAKGGERSPRPEELKTAWEQKSLALAEMEKALEKNHEESRLAEEKWQKTEAQWLAKEAEEQTKRAPEKLKHLIQRLRETLPGVFGAAGEILQPKGGEGLWSQLALGEKSGFILCDKRSTALAAIEILSKEKWGWASFVPLESVPHLPEVKVYSGKKISESIQCEERFLPAAKFLLGETVVEQGRLHAPGVISGGSAGPSFVEGGERPDLPLLQKERQEVTAKLSALREGREELLKRMAPLKTDCLNRHEAYLTAKILWAGETVKEREFREILKVCGKKEEETQKRLSEIQGELGEKQKETAALQKWVSENRAGIEKEGLHLAERRGRFDALQRQRAPLESQRQLLASETESQKRSAEEAAREIGLAPQKRKEQESIIQKAESLIESLLAEKDDSSQTLRRAEEACEEARADLSREEESLRGLRVTLDEQKTFCHRCETELVEVRAQMENLKSRLKEMFQMTLEEAMEKAKEAKPPEEGEIERLRERIFSAGAINQTAPEEHDLLRERFEFLSREREDAARAKGDLLSAIQKINATTRESFQKTYLRVQENFKAIFKTLFEGGDADLLLTEDNDLLETGVEILVQPPGKKIQNIHLLSGGESSLTAIALLFAIFQVKPSPFCILDEVDAALDEANIQRYMRMLKEFAKASQFLNITHSKRTMEMADVLYGVTMEEMGVSRMISVRLGKTPSEDSAQAPSNEEGAPSERGAQKEAAVA